jgi:hypothetical protein
MSKRPWPHIDFTLKLHKPVPWWRRFFMPMPFSPVWQRYRAARILWGGSKGLPQAERKWVRAVLVLHELFARTPIVRFLITYQGVPV